MGFLDNLRKKNEFTVHAPMKGRCVGIKEVSDPVFSDEILGKGVAIVPEEGTVYAPADGVVSAAFPTGHAVAITTGQGVEILIHVGLDTVNLNGKYFETFVQADQRVKKGDMLLRADLEKIKAEGYDVITPVIICNSDVFSEITGLTDQDTEPDTVIVRISK